MGELETAPTADVLRRLGSLETAQRWERSGAFDEAWSACLDAIGERPFHPEAFVQLASIATAAGELRTAREALHRAQALAPGWDVARELAAGFGRRGDGHGVPGRFTLPPRQSRLSVCLIVKNEERFLDSCLASIVPVAHEIVVVDTGSTDRTVEIARRHEARLASFRWCDDFSAARNAGLAMARGDWVLILDADEEVHPEDIQTLRRELDGDSNHLLLRLRCIQELKGRQYQGYVPRLFRNAPGIRFEDRIHESVTRTVSSLCHGWGMGLGLSRVRLIHHGYSPEVIQEKGKISRNHELLDRAVREDPSNATMQMQLGNEYLRMGRMDDAFRHLFVAVELCAQAPELIPDSVESLLTLLGTNLLKEERFSEVEALLAGPLAGRFPLTAWHRYLRGTARIRIGRTSEALEDLLEARARRDEETLSIVPADLQTPELDFMIGELQQKLGQSDRAEASFRSAMATDPACFRYPGATALLLSRRGRPNEALQVLLEAIPSVSESLELWRLGARITLEAPGMEAFCVEWCRDAVQNHPDDGRLFEFQIAALLQAGSTREANEILRGRSAPLSPAALGGWVFAGVCEREPALPSLTPSQQREVILSLVEILRRLETRGQASRVQVFRRNIAAYAGSLPGIAEAFEEDPEIPGNPAGESGSPTRSVST